MKSIHTHIFIGLLNHGNYSILAFVLQVALHIGIANGVDGLEGLTGAQRFEFLCQLWQIDAPGAKQNVTAGDNARCK